MWENNPALSFSYICMKKKLREQLRSEKEKKSKKKKIQQSRTESNVIVNYKSFTEEQNKTLSYLDEGK